MMKESFYRTKERKLVFHAIKSVGVKNAVRFDYKMSPSSFPRGSPTNLAPETIEVAPRKK
jgi:hypothetical protein